MGELLSGDGTLKININNRLNPPRLSFAVNTTTPTLHPLDPIWGEDPPAPDPFNNWKAAEFYSAFGVVPTVGMAGLVARWTVDMEA